ncbi:MAG: sulfite exporter TauE/SafE family protein [Bacteroidota bacterium]|nr:sulfite exporter TauE/SafE family protein [Bacteroidota bacterium]
MVEELLPYISILVGFLAGFINVFAGGGSLLTLPLLIFMGLPANVANGTNRIALLMQNVVATGSFKQQKVLKFKQAIFLVIPASIGSIIGAVIAVNVASDVLEKIIGIMLILMFFFILFKPEKWLKTPDEQMMVKPTFMQFVIFFAIGLYGGFIQAGIGFFLIAALVLTVGVDLVKANALKLFIVLIYNTLAFVVFVLNHQVDYKIGLILGIGNMLGAFVATRVAVKKGPQFARYVLLIALVISSLKLLGAF